MMDNILNSIQKELKSGNGKPFYLIYGEEPFQMSEIVQTVKDFFKKEAQDFLLCYENYDGDSTEVLSLKNSLETLPGFFEDLESKRLIFCSGIDKLAQIEVLEPYFRDPILTTCFLMTASKIDRRKVWVKSVETQGRLIEVTDPYEKDWKNWLPYFEKKLGIRIESNAWSLLAECSNHSLSIAWSELQKLATYIHPENTLHSRHVESLTTSSPSDDVFDFVEKLVCRKNLNALEKYHELLLSGENEIKILTLLVRQFRLVDHCRRLIESKQTDTKTLANALGVHPFFISKIISQAEQQPAKGIQYALHLLAEADYQLKTGSGTLFECFLIPWTQENRGLADEKV